MPALNQFAFFLFLFATGYLAAAIFLLARRRPTYSHLRDTISELGEYGSRDQHLTSFGVFLPVGVILLLVGYLLRPFDSPPALLALSSAVGYLVAAFFPCDPGSPATGIIRQSVHNLGGAVEYLGGAAALWRLSETQGSGFQVLAVVVGGVGILLSAPAVAPWRGFVQRGAEVCLFGGLAWVSEF